MTALTIFWTLLLVASSCWKLASAQDENKTESCACTSGSGLSARNRLVARLFNGKDFIVLRNLNLYCIRWSVTLKIAFQTVVGPRILVANARVFFKVSAQNSWWKVNTCASKLSLCLDEWVMYARGWVQERQLSWLLFGLSTSESDFLARQAGHSCSIAMGQLVHPKYAPLPKVVDALGATCNRLHDTARDVSVKYFPLSWNVHDTKESKHANRTNTFACQTAGQISGKYPTTKETWSKDDTSSKFPAVTCPPGKIGTDNAFGPSLFLLLRLRQTRGSFQSRLDWSEAGLLLPRSVRAERNQHGFLLQILLPSRVEWPSLKGQGCVFWIFFCFFVVFFHSLPLQSGANWTAVDCGLALHELWLVPLPFAFFQCNPHTHYGHGPSEVQSRILTLICHWHATLTNAPDLTCHFPTPRHDRPLKYHPPPRHDPHKMPPLPQACHPTNMTSRDIIHNTDVSSLRQATTTAQYSRTVVNDWIFFSQSLFLLLGTETKSEQQFNFVL